MITFTDGLCRSAWDQQLEQITDLLEPFAIMFAHFRLDGLQFGMLLEQPCT